ncbi:MAG TPA: imidazole glycerol phosphate synthase subunit HisF [Nitrososphaerales archaeon]|nr:imidazole glycerol phosphate synthase subunit HisF [Nitrososphaerales archaeon]
MTLAKRIIPCLDVKGGRVVKGVHFEGLRDAGDPVELAARYRDEGADEVVFLDITASISKRKTLAAMVRRVAQALDIPFTVGGGITSAADVQTVLRNGADKVSVNTAALARPRLIREISDTYGSQCVVVAIDAKRSSNPGVRSFSVYSHSGTRRTRRGAVEWAREAEELGAGELLVTSIDRDGTRLGYDLELLRRITTSVRLPVIASGGCGSLKHFLEAFTEGGCDAALAASLFHYGELSVGQVKAYLASKGVLMRP